MVRNMEKQCISVVERIFNLLKEKGITQKELSDMTGISTSAISDWKHKGAVPSAINVQKICEALNVGPDELLGSNTNKSDLSYEISQSHDLYEFVELYSNMNEDARKRILAYAVDMMKMEK